MQTHAGCKVRFDQGSLLMHEILLSLCMFYSLSEQMCQYALTHNQYTWPTYQERAQALSASTEQKQVKLVGADAFMVSVGLGAASRQG